MNMKAPHLSKRLLAFALSAAMCSSAPLSAAQTFTSHAAAPAEISVSAEPVDVIIKLKGYSVLGSPEARGKGTDFIGSDTADAIEAALRETQKSAEEQLRKLYPQLEITHRFTLVSNSFSCSLPENLIAQAKQLPFIESVMPVNTYTEPVPEMNNASKLCGISDFAAENGSLGEGEVIAVLDTEFTTSHPMFAPIDGKENSVSKDFVAKLAKSEELSHTIDADKAYISSKIPFAYDYSDDTPYDVSAPSNYHGTHVCGIAAGEPFKNSEGVTVSGVAPDAQLLMMKVFGTYTDKNSGRTSTTYNDLSVQCALEDAALLKADIINMSFGRNVENIGNMPYLEALANLYSAGVTICVSAGNGADNLIGRYGKANVENVDTGTVTEPSIFPFVLSVASADNSVASMHTFSAGDKSYRFCECGTKLLSSQLAGKSLDTVFFGSGDTAKINEETAKGKLIIYSGPEESFMNITALSEKAGANGVILNCEWCSNQIEYPLYSVSIPVASVSSKDMQELLMLSPKRISLPKDSSVTYELPETVSYFSSCGTDSDLDIKPEIMGIGGNVCSADCYGDTSIMSGTSMAAPYVAGCTALIDSALKKRGIYPEDGFEKTEMIKNIIMNTADIYDDDSGVPISPRRQGAGLINVYKAANTNAVLTRSFEGSDTGLAKIQLLDNVTSEITFDIQIKNISSEDITFTSNSVTLTTDGYEKDSTTGRNVISGQTLLKTENDLPEKITVYAGKSTVIPVTVNIDGAQFKEIGDIFTSGFFAEGFLTLSGAENCCDLSVPILGFCGSWTGVPNIDTISEPPVPVVNSGYSEMRTDYSAAKLIKLMQEFIKSIDGYEDPYHFAYSGDIKTCITNFAGQEFTDRTEACSDGTVYVSPDANGLADWFGIYYLPIREGAFSGINIRNDDGSIAYETDFISKNVGKVELAKSTGDATGIKDGRYTADVSSYIESPYAERDIQKIEYPLVVDTAPPTAKFYMTEKDGRKMLEVVANDPNLDGIYVMGEKINGNDDIGTNTDIAISCALNYLSHKTLYNTSETFISAFDQESITENLQKYESPMSEIFKYSGGSVYYYNYFDVIPAEPDEKGNFYTYIDVTDFNEYSVSLLDRAFNSMYTATGVLPATNFLTGTWIAHDNAGDGFFLKFDSGSKCTAVNIADRSEKELTYTIDKGDLTCFDKDGKEVLTAEVEFRSKDSANAKVTSGLYSVNTFSMQYLFTESANEDTSFYSKQELEKLALDYYEKENGYRPQHASSNVVEGNSVSIQLYDELEDHISTATYYTVSLFTASGTDIIGNSIDLTDHAPVSEGTWKSYTMTDDLNDPRFFRFNADGTGKFAWQTDGKDIPFTYTCDKGEVIFVFGDGSTDKASLSHYGCDNFLLEWANGNREYFTRLRKADNIGDIEYYTNDQLKEMAADHLFDTTGIKADEIYAMYGTDHDKVSLALLSGGDFIDNYTVSFYTGKGVNINGRPVDIAAKKAVPPTNPPSLGDIDGDGEINAVDASLILIEYAALSTGKKTTLTDEQTAAADLNDDKEVNSSDASLILGYYSFVSTGGKSTVEEYLQKIK